MTKNQLRKLNQKLDEIEAKPFEPMRPFVIKYHEDAKFARAGHKTFERREDEPMKFFELRVLRFVNNRYPVIVFYNDPEAFEADQNYNENNDS